jgi:hypothetical protein
MKISRIPKRSSLKKSLKNFMKDESGNMTKENILRLGMGTVAALSMFSGVSSAQPWNCNAGSNILTHINDNTLQWQGSDPGDKEVIPSHTHHQSHCSY